MNVVRNMVARLVGPMRRGYRFLRLYGQHLPMAFEAVFSMPCAVTLLAGTLKNGGERIAVLYVGRRMTYNYLRRLIFDECRVMDEQRTNLIAFRRHMERMADSADVLLIDLGWPYNALFNRRREYLEVPDWVNMVLELPDTWEQVVQTFRPTTRNNDLRLIRRNGYRCVPTSDRSAVEDFYDNFHLPFVSQKHAEDAVISPRKHVLKRGMQGALLQVLRDTEVVAAGIVYPEHDTLFFLWMGLPQRYVETPPEGAVSALYLFGIRYAFDRGCKVVDFTGTRAFLNDGAFRFKRKWGTRVDDSFSPSSILIRPRDGSRNGAEFCRRVPVLARSAGGLEAVFVTGEAGGEALLAKLAREHGCEGVRRARVIEISDENETTSVSPEGDKCEYRLTRSRAESFADCYVGRGQET